MSDKIYNEERFTNFPISEIKKSNILGFIPLSEVDSFSNREKYMCIVASQYQKIYEDQIAAYDDALRDMVMEFGTTNGYGNYGDSTLDSRDSDALEKAFEVLHVKDGDDAFYVWGIHEGGA